MCVIVVGALTQAWPLALLGVIGLVGALAIISMRQRASVDDGGLNLDDLDAESRMLLRPFGRLRAELDAVVRRHPDQPGVRVVGQEALHEADRIVAQATRLVQAHAQLKRTFRGKSEASLQARRLEAQLETARTDAERESLASAIEARRQEIAQYERLESAVVDAESRLREAEASLSELKARLVTGAASQASSDLMQDELGDVVSGLKSLGKSFDEAETMMQEQMR